MTAIETYADADARTRDSHGHPDNLTTDAALHAALVAAAERLGARGAVLAAGPQIGSVRRERVAIDTAIDHILSAAAECGCLAAVHAATGAF